MSDATTTPQPTAPLTPQARYDAALAALQAKQRKFVAHYLASLNASQAARQAGYSEKTAGQIGYQLLQKTSIAAAVSAGMALQAMPAGEILARLSAHARGSMADFLRVDEEEIQVSWSVLELPADRDGNPDLSGTIYDLAKQQIVKPTQRILHTATVKRSVARLDLLAAGQAGKLGLVKKYSLDEDTGKVGIEIYDAQAALIALGKHHKLWGDDGLGGILKSIDLTKLRPDQLERLSAGDDPIAVLLGQ
jgi:phage terminase small subunit